MKRIIFAILLLISTISVFGQTTSGTVLWRWNTTYGGHTDYLFFNHGGMTLFDSLYTKTSVDNIIHGLSGIYQPLENQRLSTSNDVTHRTLSFTLLQHATTGFNGFLVADPMIKYRTFAEVLSDLGITTNVVTSIANLQAFSLAATSVYVSATDGTGGWFNYSTSSLTDDGGIVVAATGKGSGHWVRDYDQAKGVNVRWWGAKSDNITDATAAFRAAKAFIKTLGGGDVQVTGGGTFLLTDTLRTAVKYTRFIGDGATSIHSTVTANVALLVYHDYCSVENINFIGTGTDAGDITKGTLVYIQGASHCSVLRCTFTGAGGNSIEYNVGRANDVTTSLNPSYTMIADNKIFNPAGATVGNAGIMAGYGTTSQLNHNTVVRNEIHGNGVISFGVLAIASGYGNHFSDNKIYNTKSYAIAQYLQAGAADSSLRDCHIDRNYIDTTGVFTGTSQYTSAVYQQSCYNCSANFNTIKHAGFGALILSLPTGAISWNQAMGSEAIGNDITDCPNIPAINIANAYEGFRVIGNKSSNSLQGIKIAASNKGVVTANRFLKTIHEGVILSADTIGSSSRPIAYRGVQVGGNMTVDQNEIEAGYAGIAMNGTTTDTIYNAKIFHNNIKSSYNLGAIYVSYIRNSDISTNTITGSGLTYGIAISGVGYSSNNKVDKNTINSSGTMTQAIRSEGTLVSVVDNTILSATTNDLYINGTTYANTSYHSGSETANSFIKIGGTGTNLLNDDGTVTAKSSLSPALTFSTGLTNVSNVVKADTTILQTIANFFPKGDTRYAKSSVAVTGGVINWPAGTIYSTPTTGTYSGGTLTFGPTLATQSANKIFAGPSSGGAVAPTFRSLVTADIPTTLGTTIINGTVTASAGAAFGLSLTPTITGAANGDQFVGLDLNPTISSAFTYGMYGLRITSRGNSNDAQLVLQTGNGNKATFRYDGSNMQIGGNGSLFLNYNTFYGGTLMPNEGTGNGNTTFGTQNGGFFSINSGQSLLSGSSNLFARTFFAGPSISTAANSNYANVVIGSATVNIGSGFTMPMVASMAIKAPIISSGTSVATNAATLYLDGAPSGGSNNWALYINSGNGYFGGTLNVVGAAHFNGFQAAVNTFGSGSTTALTSNYTIQGNATSGTCTVQLPAASSAIGTVYIVKKIDSSANTVVITPNGADTIDGAASLTISVQYKGYTIQASGNAWLVVGSF